jgi:hypothetical protein
MATGSLASDGMLPLAAGTSGSPIRGGGQANRGDGRACTRPMDSTDGAATGDMNTTAADVKIMYWNKVADIQVQLPHVTYLFGTF